ncbi:Zinc/iron permease [Fomitiporia mediterranea MF3/22]|uniref:Zinc/iron permease n=1 Tax=Fomitiporia mediterranea (strain MF3/22) TaxID=694068 RepID=UPI0004407B2B|nr:Zinc/iron permease [Fomitiporia mediterranea MF3/22]EJC98106.1 Zinc/iron permease [Fomitiporia mediterranea MF3/22]
MSAFLIVLLMSAALGATSFGIGMLPLFFTFSRTHIEQLSTLGTGLLLGAALGIIIPEGVETLVSSSPSDPAPKIALSLISGFSFMLLVEQLTSGHAHGHGHGKHFLSPSPRTTPLDSRNAHTISVGSTSSNEEFDISLAELEEAEGLGSGTDRGVRQPMLNHRRTRSDEQSTFEKPRAIAMTLGLVIHSLADGLALAASALPRKVGEGEGQNTQLWLLVFFALMVHKAPTALALSMSLMSSLSAVECRKHLAVFSAATPFGALASFGLLRLIGAGADGDWTGVALLVSGGTFLYVATVLQPVSHQETRSPSSSEMNEKVRVGIIIIGMFIPFLISLISGHEH